MVYQGVVMEVERSHIIVLTDDTDYVKLKKKGNIDIGKKIMFIEEDIIKKSNKSYKPLLGIAAAIILMIVTIIGQFGVDFAGYFQAYAIVSLDINPSLQFQIDESRIVKKINCLNNDGEEIVDDNMVGMVIEDAVILSIKKAISKQYLNNESNVVLVSDVILGNNSEPTTAIENEIFEKIEEDEELQDINLIYVNSDKDDLEKANENHVSVGKYKVYEIISNNKPEVKVEDIKNKKVSDIVKENRDLTEEDMVKTKKKEKRNKDKNNLIKDIDYTKKTKIHDKNHENKNNEKPNHEKKSDEKQQEKGKAEIKGKEVNHNKYKEKEHKEIKNENKINEVKGNGSPKNNNTKGSPDKGFEKKDQENSSKENVKYDDHKNEKAKEHNTSKKENKNNKDNKDSKKEKENNDDKEDKNKKTNNKNKGK